MDKIGFHSFRYFLEGLFRVIVGYWSRDRSLLALWRVKQSVVVQISFEFSYIWLDLTTWVRPNGIQPPAGRVLQKRTKHFDCRVPYRELQTDALTAAIDSSSMPSFWKLSRSNLNLRSAFSVGSRRICQASHLIVSSRVLFRTILKRIWKPAEERFIAKWNLISQTWTRREHTLARIRPFNVASGTGP